MTHWAFLRGQDEYLARQGFDVHLVATPGPWLNKLVTRAGVTVHGLPICRQISPLADALSLIRLYRLFRRLRPQIAHVSTPKAALLGALAAWAAAVPVRVFLMRGLACENAAGWRKRLYRFAEWLTAYLCHQSICVSPSLRSLARAERILGPTQGLVPARGMSNGIDVRRFDSQTAARPEQPLFGLGDCDRRTFVLGFVGRLARDKGIEQLAASWRQLRADYQHLRLLLVGPWEEACPVPEEVRRPLQQDPRVHVTGHVDDVVPYLKAMSLLVFPSHGTEGFPNAPMEAAAMGLPVVASRVAGCVDAVEDGRTGTLVPPKSPPALTAAICRYVDDEALGRQHGQAGQRRVVQHFQPQPIWRALLEEYRRLLQEHHQPLPTAVPQPAKSPSRRAA
jgi:glycosyltransferase involved in cell wall biosynthesis